MAQQHAGAGGEGKWALFVGGVVLGSALAAGLTYAGLSYSSAQAAEAEAARHRRRNKQGTRPLSPRRMSRVRSGTPVGAANGEVREGPAYYQPPGSSAEEPRNHHKHHDGADAAAGGSGWQHQTRRSATPLPLPPASSSSRLEESSFPQRGPALRSRGEATDLEDGEWATGRGATTDAAPSVADTGLRGDSIMSGDDGGPAGRGGMHVYMDPANRSNAAAREYVTEAAALAAAGVAQHQHHVPHAPPPLLPPPLLAQAAAQHAMSHGGVPAAVSAAYLAGAPPAPHALTSSADMATEGKLIEDAAMHDQYCRVITPEPGLNEETEDVCALLKQCLDLRDKWMWRPAVSPERQPGPEVAAPSALEPDPFAWQPLPVSGYEFEMVEGIVRVFADASRSVEPFPLPGNAYDFFSDMHRVLKIQSMGPVKTLCHHRLLLLEQKFNLHMMLNADKEFLAQKSAPHRDFYNVRKIDTHVHHSACMHQKHLLRFIKSKLRKEPDEVVIFRDGKYLTLKEVFESLRMTGYDLSVDTLDMHADKNTFHRFDKFNLKYNPFGQSRLREIFIKQDNLLHGRFLAELTREVLNDLESSKYQHAEYRISVYGRKRVEWDILAAWIVQNRLQSDNVVWLIQVPRLYNVYKEQGIIDNFEQLLDNIFTPLFEVSVDPNSHPQLHLFLKQVVGFDMVDDESKPERRPAKHMQTPREWNLKHNPAYSYYAYYIYANLFVLNKLREARGLSTFAFRPHAGEAGDIDHLVSAMMLCQNIAHGINLRKSPCLQYLFYLHQIGLCMSPLSNNSLFLDYHRNPFPTFFARGLSISLSTDDPLQIHLTKEPLVEEYSVAAQVWKLSATDLCEIARNSVLHSGFPHQVKMHWVARQYWRAGPEGNDIHKTNVPNLRMRFRFDTYCDETALVAAGAHAHAARTAAAKARNELQ